MTNPTSTSSLTPSCRLAALAILSVSTVLSGCTGEPSNPTPAPSTSAPASSQPSDDKTPKVPGGKGDMMEGIPKK